MEDKTTTGRGEAGAGQHKTGPFPHNYYERKELEEARERLLNSIISKPTTFTIGKGGDPIVEVSLLILKQLSQTSKTTYISELNRNLKRIAQEEFHVAGPCVGRHLKNLISKGLVCNDGHRKYSLTEKGKELMEFDSGTYKDDMHSVLTLSKFFRNLLFKTIEEIVL